MPLSRPHAVFSPTPGTPGMLSTLSPISARVDDQFRADAELGLHALDVIDAAGHGVDQGDVRADQLGHVLVAGGDHHITAQRRALPRQGADDVVCLDPFHAQQRQPQCTDAGMQRLDLRAGRRASAGGATCSSRTARREGRTLGIENHCERAVRILPAQAKQHVQHTLDRTGRLAGRGGQRRQRVGGAVQVGRTVHQDEGAWLMSGINLFGGPGARMRRTTYRQRDKVTMRALKHLMLASLLACALWPASPRSRSKVSRT